MEAHGLKRLVGHWQGEESLAASPWAPASTATAQVSYREALSGRIVLQDYRQHRADQALFEAHAVFMTDPTSGETLCYTFDSYGYPPESPARGRWQGQVLRLEKVSARGVARHVLSLDADRLSHDIDLRPTGQPDFRPFMRALYRRGADS